MADYDKLIELEPQKALAYLGRGITLLMMGNVDASHRDLARAVQLDSTWTIQCNLWIWEMHTLRGGNRDGETAIDALGQAEKAAIESAESKLVGICRGTCHAEEIFSTTTDPFLRGLACYYQGVRQLVELREADAKAWFEKCRTLCSHDQPEYDLAQHHLRQLESHEAISGSFEISGSEQHIKASPATRGTPSE